MEKVTQWFDGETKPVHSGDYESSVLQISVLEGGAPIHLDTYWDGKFWRWSHNGNACIFQDRTWRGLAVKPKSGIKTRSPQAK